MQITLRILLFKVKNSITMMFQCVANLRQNTSASIVHMLGKVSSLAHLHAVNFLSILKAKRQAICGRLINY